MKAIRTLWILLNVLLHNAVELGRLGSTVKEAIDMVVVRNLIVANSAYLRQALRRVGVLSDVSAVFREERMEIALRLRIAA